MITGDEVERIFIDRFPQLAMWRPPFGRKVYCWDVYYSLPTFEDLEKLFEEGDQNTKDVIVDELSKII